VHLSSTCVYRFNRHDGEVDALQMLRYTWPDALANPPTLNSMLLESHVALDLGFLIYSREFDLAINSVFSILVIIF